VQETSSQCLQTVLLLLTAEIKTEDQPTKDVAAFDQRPDMLIRSKRHLVLGCEFINVLHPLTKVITKGASTVVTWVLSLVGALEPVTIRVRASRLTLQFGAAMPMETMSLSRWKCRGEDPHKSCMACIHGSCLPQKK